MLKSMQTWARGSVVVQTKHQNGEEMWSIVSAFVGAREGGMTVSETADRGFFMRNSL